MLLYKAWLLFVGFGHGWPPLFYLFKCPMSKLLNLVTAGNTQSKGKCKGGEEEDEEEEEEEKGLLLLNTMVIEVESEVPSEHFR